MVPRPLGTLTVSPIGMGCMDLSHGYGAIPNRAYSIQAIRRAHAFGCTFFATAEAYGPNMLPENRGHNERILGEAVHPFRKEVVLATKLHPDTAEAAITGPKALIQMHLTASPDRLQSDYADLIPENRKTARTARPTLGHRPRRKGTFCRNIPSAISRLLK